MKFSSFSFCKPAMMTAILGPSGSGKTSFLTALAGRAHYGRIGGVVRLNGVAEPINKYRTVLGFVPQEDVMIRTLTVRQVLVFSANMRLPQSVSSADRATIVDAVLEVLELTDVQDQRIGDGIDDQAHFNFNFFLTIRLQNLFAASVVVNESA